jgi:hypothetical protein
VTRRAALAPKDSPAPRGTPAARLLVIGDWRGQLIAVCVLGKIRLANDR